MRYTCDEEVEYLVGEFLACRLPRPEWTHAAHITVAVWFLYHDDADNNTAINGVRDGIRAYNEAWGILPTLTGGYHETLTLFYLKTLRHYLPTLEPSLPLHAIANAAIEAFSDRALLLRHYTKARLMSPEARATWVEPDLIPLQS